MRTAAWTRRLTGSAVPVAGLALLGAWTAAAAAPWPVPTVYVLWLGLLFFAGHSTLPWATERLGLSGLVGFAALLLFGAAPAGWLVLGASVLVWIWQLSGRSLRAWKRWSLYVAETGGQRLVALGLAAFVLQRLGGQTGAAFGVEPFVALVAATSTWIAAATITAWWLDRRRPTRSAVKWQELVLRAAWEALQLGGAVAWTLALQRLGTPAYVLLFVPLALAAVAAMLWQRAQRGHVEAVRTLVAAIDAADPMTRGQAGRIARMSVQVARRLGLTASEVEELEYAALLHEVGRTAIQRDLMYKAGALSNQEQTLMRTHPRLGSETVQRFGFFPAAARLVLAHHEQPDGRGYPNGWRAEAIPLGSRILMATAAFDAMTSDRPYRPGLAPETAVQQLLALAGTQFFTDVVEALIDLYTSGELFAAFTPAELEHFARGENGSRLLQEHLRRLGQLQPDAAARETAAEGAREDDGVPVLELPPASRQDVLEEEIPLRDPGEHLLQVAALTDVGCAREQNEDAFGVFPGAESSRGCLLVVADGMGGAAAGEIASGLAVDLVRENFYRSDAPGDGGEVLQKALRLANELIHWRANSESELGGMGTTCTAAALAGMTLTVGHVGDSRAYLLREDSVEILTRDHTLAAELQLVAGSEAPLEARNVLTRCLGTRAEVEIDVSRRVTLQAGDVLVLCTDGLHNQLPAHEIRAIARGESPALACTRLVERAVERGGPDNITVIVARVLNH